MYCILKYYFIRFDFIGKLGHGDTKTKLFVPKVSYGRYVVIVVVVVIVIVTVIV